MVLSHSVFINGTVGKEVMNETQAHSDYFATEDEVREEIDRLLCGFSISVIKAILLGLSCKKIVFRAKITGFKESDIIKWDVEANRESVCLLGEENVNLINRIFLAKMLIARIHPACLIEHFKESQEFKDRFAVLEGSLFLFDEVRVEFKDVIKDPGRFINILEKE